MSRVKDRVIKIRFNADTAAAMTWNFKPQQTEIKVSLLIFHNLFISVYIINMI